MLAESFFDSPVFPPPKGVKYVKYWKQACGIHHFKDIINPESGDFYTPLELHKANTGSTHTRALLPKLYKGMVWENTLAEFDALIAHVSQQGGTLRLDEIVI